MCIQYQTFYGDLLMEDDYKNKLLEGLHVMMVG